MAALRILVCDDRNSEDVADTIKDGAPEGTLVEARDEKTLSQLVRDLFGSATEMTGIRGFLATPVTERANNVPTTDFDKYSVIILDNDLAEIDVGEVPLTAEAIAGFIRAFSEANYVISLNKNPLLDFDLKYLVGDYETKADLSLRTDHLAHAGLWRGGVSDGSFCPWYWPALDSAADRRAKQVGFVLENLDRPIIAALGFPSKASDLLSPRAVGFLSPTATRSSKAAEEGNKPLKKVTFWDHFKKSNRSLTMDYRAMIVAPEEPDPQARADKLRDMNRAPKDPLTRQIIARVVAAEIDFWIRRDVLGPQEILTDAPHLQMKLRLGLADTPEAWNQTANSLTPPFGLHPKLYTDAISPHRFSADCWVPRPAFWWPSIEGSKELTRLRATLEVADDIIVFCEDSRRFVKRTPDGNEAKSFIPDGGKPWRPFFVERSTPAYSPQSQFAA